jgi:hypothetical protein
LKQANMIIVVKVRQSERGTKGLCATKDSA